MATFDHASRFSMTPQTILWQAQHLQQKKKKKNFTRDSLSKMNNLVFQVYSFKKKKRPR